MEWDALFSAHVIFIEKSMLLEVACFSLEGAIIAEKAGAQRIELCSSPLEGGLTPSLAMIKGVRKLVSIPVFVMIRPREGDFLYTGREFESMLEDVAMVKDQGMDGVVSGALLPDGSVDAERTEKLVLAASPMQVTFHRAFDLTRDPVSALQDIIGTGAKRILTSGQKQTAMEGKEMIASLVKAAADRICIMPGSGVNPSNIEMLAAVTGASEYHASARKIVRGAMQYLNPDVSLHAGTAFRDNSLLLPDAQQIREMLSCLVK